MRTIKFRGHRLHTKEWVMGYYNQSLTPAVYNDIITKDRIQTGLENYFVVPYTVGQFTGYKDKNGVEIYEGDIIQYYYLKRYTQQSHYDVRPEIDEMIIKRTSDTVVFKNGCFLMSKEAEIEEFFPYLTPLSEYGLFSVERVKEDIFGDLLEHLSEEEKSGDCDGTDINESIIGIEIIGNIHDNPNLLK